MFWFWVEEYEDILNLEGHKTLPVNPLNQTTFIVSSKKGKVRE